MENMGDDVSFDTTGGENQNGAGVWKHSHNPTIFAFSPQQQKKLKTLIKSGLNFHEIAYDLATTHLGDNIKEELIFALTNGSYNEDLANIGQDILQMNTIVEQERVFGKNATQTLVDKTWHKIIKNLNTISLPSLGNLDTPYSEYYMIRLLRGHIGGKIFIPEASLNPTKYILFDKAYTGQKGRHCRNNKGRLGYLYYNRTETEDSILKNLAKKAGEVATTQDMIKELAQEYAGLLMASELATFLHIEDREKFILHGAAGRIYGLKFQEAESKFNESRVDNIGNHINTTYDRHLQKRYVDIEDLLDSDFEIKQFNPHREMERIENLYHNTDAAYNIELPKLVFSTIEKYQQHIWYQFTSARHIITEKYIALCNNAFKRKGLNIAIHEERLYNNIASVIAQYDPTKAESDRHGNDARNILKQELHTLLNTTRDTQGHSIADDANTGNHKTDGDEILQYQHYIESYVGAIKTLSSNLWIDLNCVDKFFHYCYALHGMYYHYNKALEAHDADHTLQNHTGGTIQPIIANTLWFSDHRYMEPHRKLRNTIQMQVESLYLKEKFLYATIIDLENDLQKK